MRPEAASPVLADQAVLEQAWYPCQTGRAAIELHLRSSMGDDHLVAVRPIRDRIASAFNGAVRWMGTHLHYQEELDNPAGPLRLASFDYDLQTFRSTSIAKPADTGIAVSPGPAGGILGTVGYGASRRLVERGGREGDHDYGPALFSLGDPRTAGNWLSPDGKTVIVGTRYFDRPRFGLEWLSRTARHAIGGDESFMKCDFQPDLAFGFCIREGITKPPELVEVEPGSARISHALFLSPRHQEIAPLKVVARTWSSHLGDETSGFVMLPRGYVPGRRYPMIVVTHAGDADQRFAAAEFQWNYPIQLFAEEGFVVMAINDPSPAWSEVLSRAIAAWGGEKNGTSPLQVRQQVWLNGAVAIEDAVRELVQEGLADPARLGIAGYSRGSQMAQVTMTQSHLFRAVSSGDGDVLDPSSWWDGRPDYLSVFGGSPYDASVSAYRELSPHLRAAQVSAAVLQQMAVPRQGALLLHRQLVAAGVPAEIVVYPGETPDSSETHMFHIPSNKKRAMLENLAWFDVWLKGTVPPDAPSSEQTEKWLGMSKALPIATSVRP